MSEILTLTGSKFKTASNARPLMRLVRDDDQANADLIAPMSDAIFQVGANAVKYAGFLNDRDEARRILHAEIDERLGYVEDVA